MPLSDALLIMLIIELRSTVVETDVVDIGALVIPELIPTIVLADPAPIKSVSKLLLICNTLLLAPPAMAVMPEIFALLIC